MDLGCGTGILSVIANHFKIGGAKVAIDNMQQAIDCAEINAKIYGFGNEIITKNIDLREVYSNEFLFKETAGGQKKKLGVDATS